MTDATQEFGEPDRTAGGVVDGRYRLEEPVSGGVTATTWRAHDPVLGRDVAVKIWRDACPDAHRSQQDELGAARLLDPNLNELLDAGEHEGRPFLVREIAVEQPSDPVPPPSAAVPAPRDAPPPLTPVTGTPVAAPRRRSDRVVMASVATILIAALLVGVGLLARPGSDERPSGPQDTTPVAPARVESFDPEGDGRENPDELGALLDGDPATTWSSDRYNSRKFGNLKPGLGLVLRFASAEELAALTVTSESGGWSAQIYVADSPSPDLEGWGAAFEDITDAGRSEEIQLGGRSVGAVLIWFTDLGTESNRLTIAELSVSGAA